MGRYDQITEMEGILDAHRAMLDRLDALLSEYEAGQKDFKRLVDYYDSPQWLKDYEFSNTDEFSPDVKCGVLSEDSVFDLLGDNRRAAERMRDLAGKVLREK